MNKILLMVSTVALLSGCGAYEISVAQVSGYSIICVKETGINYVQFPSGVAPLITRGGRVVPCGGTPKIIDPVHSEILPPELNQGGSFAD